MKLTKSGCIILGGNSNNFFKKQQHSTTTTTTTTTTTITLSTRHRAFPREGYFPLQGELALAILRTPAHPIPSFPALRREDNTHPWNTDDRIKNKNRDYTGTLIN